MIRLQTTEDLEMWWRTVWAEARGESFNGQCGVANVIANRVSDGRWGHTFEAVCLAPKQFSCWNEGDPNRGKALSVNLSDPTALRAHGICALVAWGDLPDITNGATHYFATYIPEPEWAKQMVTTIVIGKHRFLRESR